MKRRSKRTGGVSKIRRSSSHSPKSAKAGAPRKLGSISSGVDTDSERKVRIMRELTRIKCSWGSFLDTLGDSMWTASCFLKTAF